MQICLYSWAVGISGPTKFVFRPILDRWWSIPWRSFAFWRFGRAPWDQTCQHCDCTSELHFLRRIFWANEKSGESTLFPEKLQVFNETLLYHRHTLMSCSVDYGDFVIVQCHNLLWICDIFACIRSAPPCLPFFLGWQWPNLIPWIIGWWVPN